MLRSAQGKDRRKDGRSSYTAAFRFQIDKIWRRLIKSGSVLNQAMAEVNLLVINPNSSESITNGLQASLGPLTPPGARLSYFTAPPHAPKAIINTVTAIQTAAFCYEALLESGALSKYDGFLICCCKCALKMNMLRVTNQKFACPSLRPSINAYAS